MWRAAVYIETIFVAAVVSAAQPQLTRTDSTHAYAAGVP